MAARITTVSVRSGRVRCLSHDSFLALRLASSPPAKSSRCEYARVYGAYPGGRLTYSDVSGRPVVGASRTVPSAGEHHPVAMLLNHVKVRDKAE